MNNDLISRSALIDTFSNTVFFDEDSKCKALELIDNAPTVYPICEDKACKYRANERLQGKSEKWKCCECYIRAKETGALLFCEAVGKCKFEKGGAE